MSDNDKQPDDQQQSKPPDWAVQLIEGMQARQADPSSSPQSQAGDPTANPSTAEQSQPAAPDYGKLDPDRIVRDAETFARIGTQDALKLFNETYLKATGGISQDRVTELELRTYRTEAALEFGLTKGEAETFLTGRSEAQIAAQAKQLKAYKDQLKAEAAKSEDNSQGQTTQQQPANNQQASFRQDERGNVIIVPGNYPDTRSPIEKAKAAIAEKMAKGESIYQ